MGNIDFTIFTPTYNRAHTICKLFESLVQQSGVSFEWLIVDDGSTDNTRELVTKFSETANFKINYIYQNNSGKHVAINNAAKVAKGKWFFIVDSDDFLCKDALKIAFSECKIIENDTTFAGVVGLRIDTNGNTLGGEVNKDRLFCDSVDYRYKYRISGDRAEIIRTSILRKYPFPSIFGEKFMPESWLWVSLAKDGYKFLWFNKGIYVTEYLQDGLTNNIHSVVRKSPMSVALVDDLMTSIERIPLKTRFIFCVNYYRHGRFSGKSYLTLYRKSRCKIMGLISIPLACIFKMK